MRPGGKPKAFVVPSALLAAGKLSTMKREDAKMELGKSIEALRAFLPARDFAISREFYRAIGFVESWSSEKLVLFQLGRSTFFLQDYFVQDWAENMMMDLRVVDADAWWAHLQSLRLAQRFPTGVRLVPPQDDPASSIRRGSFTDPSGVLWHFSQSTKDAG